ncbi:MAG: hypothetical protein WC050_04480 [Candidatus Paceibacterota bacterium]
MTLVGALALAAAILYASERNDREATTFFSNALKQANVTETVSYQGTTYTIKNGTVLDDTITVRHPAMRPILELAYEKAVARRSPLFAMPGVDLSQFRTAVQQLALRREELASKQKSASEARLVRRGLYPVDFLSAIADAEEARRMFLDTGSWDAAFTYEGSKSVALSTYAADLANYKASFSQAVPRSDDILFETYTDRVSRAYILAALDTLEQGSRQIKNRDAGRALCLKGFVRKCDVTDLELPPIATQLSPITESDIALAEDVRDMYTRTGYSIDTNAPLVHISSSFCFSDPKKNLLFSFESRVATDDQTPYLTPVLVSDVVFVRSERYAGLPFYGSFASNNITYALQDFLAPYSCTQLDGDLGKIDALRQVHDFAVSNRISTYGDGPDARALAQIERKIERAAYIGDTDASDYLRTAHALASSASSTVPQDLSDQIISLWLQVAYASTGAYQELLNGNFFYKRSAIVNREGDEVVFGARSLFLARSAFSALFMSSNLSVTGEHGPLFPTAGTDADERPYLFYSSSAHSAQIREEVMRGMAFYHTISYGEPE